MTGEDTVPWPAVGADVVPESLLVVTVDSVVETVVTTRKKYFFNKSDSWKTNMFKATKRKRKLLCRGKVCDCDCASSNV